MKEYLIKSYESIIENQRNSDGKANLFIVLITGFLTFFDTVSLNITNNQQVDGLQAFYIMLISPLILLILSLVPRYSGKIIYMNRKKKMELNIFYWKTMTYYTSHQELEEEIKRKYDESDFNQKNKDLIKQIYVNSIILETKSMLHRYAFFIINQLIIIFTISLIGSTLFNNNIWITFYSLIGVEIMIVLFYYDVLSKIRKLFNRRKE